MSHSSIKNRLPKQNKKESGILTLDFVFSVAVMFSISMVFALMALTLMMSSVAQYITFTTNRAHIAGHVGFINQFEAADAKFNNIVGKLSPLFKVSDKGWFKVEMSGGPIGPADFDPPNARQKKYGFVVRYTSNIIKNAKLPIIGNPSDGSSTSNFGSANLNAYMYREPTSEECLQFNANRWKKILSRFPNLSGLTDDSTPHGASADNGC